MPEVSSAYPQAAGRHFSPFSIEDLWAAPDGWPIRRITCPALHRDGSLLAEGAGRGRLLFMPGRGDIYEKYLESLDDWQRCGWHVTALDWRGQGGSGRLGLDDTTGHIGDFTQWVNDLSAFWREWVRPVGGPHVLVAHSMGGHLALRAVVERKLTPDALILSAPMLGSLLPACRCGFSTSTRA
jgi:lysophospholipase